MTMLGLIIKQNTCTEEYLIFYINLQLYMYIRSRLFGRDYFIIFRHPYNSLNLKYKVNVRKWWTKQNFLTLEVSKHDLMPHVYMMKFPRYLLLFIFSI